MNNFEKVKRLLFFHINNIKTSIFVHSLSDFSMSLTVLIIHNVVLVIFNIGCCHRYEL